MIKRKDCLDLLNIINFNVLEYSSKINNLVEEYISLEGISKIHELWSYNKNLDEFRETFGNSMDVSILKNLFTNEREQLIYSKINEIFKKYFLKAIEIYNSNCLTSNTRIALAKEYVAKSISSYKKSSYLDKKYLEDNFFEFRIFYEDFINQLKSSLENPEIIELKSKYSEIISKDANILKDIKIIINDKVFAKINPDLTLKILNDTLLLNDINTMNILVKNGISTILSFNADLDNNLIIDFNLKKHFIGLEVILNNLLLVLVSKLKYEYKYLNILINYKDSFYELKLLFLLNAGFSIKGSVYNEETRNLMMKIDDTNKNMYVIDLEKLLNIGIKIRDFENRFSKKELVIDNESIKKIIPFVLRFSNEISGSFFYSSDGKLITDDKHLLIPQNQKFLEKREDITDELVNQVFSSKSILFDVINFHTHPYISYIKNKQFLAPPSYGNYSARIQPFRLDIKEKYAITDLYKCHIVFTIECMYVLQVHPYWIQRLSSMSLNKSCNYYLNYLIIIGMMYINKLIYLKDKEKFDYNNFIYELNNKFNLNLISKQFDFSKDIYTWNVIDGKFQKKVIDPKYKLDTRDKWKKLCIEDELDRNLNLFCVSFIEYPFKSNSILAKIDKKDRFDYMTKIIGERDFIELEKEFLESMDDEDIKVPYFES